MTNLEEPFLQLKLQHSRDEPKDWHKKRTIWRIGEASPELNYASR